MPKKKIKGIVVTDLDGTLLRSDLTFNNKDIETIKKLKEQNYLVVIATGRTLYSFKSDIDTKLFPFDYLVFSNGGGIINTKNNKLDVSKCFKQYEVNLIYHQLLMEDVDFYYTAPPPENHFCYYVKHNTENVEFQKRLQAVSHFAKPVTNGELPVKVGNFAVFYNTLTLQEAYKRISSIFPFFKVITMAADDRQRGNRVEIYPSGISKARAVAHLAAKYNISKKDIITIGNDFNDIDMLDWSENSFVVSNAQPKLISKYESVSSNDESGFSEAIKRWISLV